MEPFEQVYQDHFEAVYRFACSLCGDPHLAEEITQETFFKALREIKHFRGECSLKSWLFQIARNDYLSRCRKNRHLAPWESVPEREDGKSLEDRLLERESALELHRRLHRLPEPYREVFTLRLFGELSYAEIGELFSKSESWARTTYYRAKNKLKEELT